MPNKRTIPYLPFNPFCGISWTTGNQLITLGLGWIRVNMSTYITVSGISQTDIIDANFTNDEIMVYNEGVYLCEGFVDTIGVAGGLAEIGFGINLAAPNTYTSAAVAQGVAGLSAGCSVCAFIYLFENQTVSLWARARAASFNIIPNGSTTSPRLVVSWVRRSI